MPGLIDKVPKPPHVEDRETRLWLIKVWERLTTVLLKDEMLPWDDDTGSIGKAGFRFKLVRATTVTAGDLAFDDPGCASCGKGFRYGDTVLLTVKRKRAGVTYTAPVHQACTWENAKRHKS